MHTAQYFHFRGQQLIPVSGVQQRTGRLKQIRGAELAADRLRRRIRIAPAIKASPSVA